MLKVQEIRELIKLIDESTIDEFTYESNGTKVAMKKEVNNGVVETKQVVQPAQPVIQETVQPVQAPKAETAEQSEGKDENKTSEKPDTGGVDFDHEITSPMVGTFYRSPSPDSDTYVEVGSNVQASSVVCIVEAMKLFNEIEAEVSGEIVEILAEDGQLVEYGQPLFRVKTK
ncbi:acetyl-CoA carboxylase biotin carboxyl carrier protein [Salirhabdus salicampi]|uniref:acetyl-CoA carboxylase biotin carboxyl carrier protein n=1 Tax=Salirhabdus salicampi TaxID=476102 RepID=UPI0020C4A508|nr:acetyl-CoA carboxylase biotin carboxyl carrier protein [Salirhabdus salicampi]MCP8616819.1 acetyl-CoA carboxylase biotin carboxyl carrier protein [Salirhabdus salicampi]